jgi:hypothetical protein
MHTKSHKEWFGHSKVDGEDTDIQAARLYHKPTFILFFFFQNKESRLKTINMTTTSF